MKKSVLLVVLFALFICPRKVLATSCCSQGHYEEHASYKGCCQQASCVSGWTGFDSSKFQCGGYLCDVGSQQCTSSLPTTDPTCRPGYNELNQIGLRDCIQKDANGHTVDLTKTKCCQDWGLGFCKIKDGGNWLWPACSDYTLEDKDNCADYGTNWKFDRETWKCIGFMITTWDPKIVTCSDGKEGVDTAIGCVPTGDLKTFLAFVLKWAFFASGGIIVLMIIATGFTILTSGGNPEKLQGAKENITSIIGGFILIAFALVILKVIGADILQLPTFK